MSPRPRNRQSIAAALKGLSDAKLRWIPPMLAKPSAQLPEGDAWWYEVKFDGYRSLVVKNKGSVSLWSRRGNPLDKRFPELLNAFDFLPEKTAIDGEIVALDKEGRPSFATLQNSVNRRQSLYFYAFDVIAYKGKDTTRVALRDRRPLLDDALSRARDPVRLSAVFHEDSKNLVGAVRTHGLEGVVAKRLNSIYESGERSGAWIKYKTNRGQELVIGGYQPGTNGFESLLVGFYEGNNLIFIAKIKNGFTPALRRQITKKFSALETDTCPFANLPEPKNARRGKALTTEVMKEMRWLKPRLVAQIEFTDWTEANHLRHSRFVALRDDKPPKSVVREN